MMNWFRGRATAQTIIGTGLVLLCAVMPFHAFLVIAAGNSFGHQALFQGWKELVIILLLLVAAGAMITQRLDWRPLWRRTPLIAAAFIVLSILVSLTTNQVRDSSFLYGVKTDLVPLVVYALALLVAHHRLNHRLERIVVISGTIVGFLALIQVWLLPADFLRHFGYSAANIVPAQYINPGAMTFPRAFATLGGPNQLGAFLIIPLSLLTARLMRKATWVDALFLIISLGGLIQTYSRSAWIGAAIAMFLTVCLHLNGHNLRRFLAGSVILGILGGAALQSVVAGNLNWQYLFLHQPSASHATQGSDLQRSNWQAQSLDILRAQPLGGGLGSAGPASRYSLNKPLISENFYLQIALETGIIGLILFLLLMGSLGVDLWLVRHAYDNLLARPLLAALIGILVTNLFLHTWADSTLVLIFWALAGVSSTQKDQK
jgi:putative inorganic carbon (HCO3(-)) transporter